MRLEDFHYDLPDGLIATAPAEPRDRSRLLVASRSNEDRHHRRFSDLGEWLRPGDLLVLNDTKVFPARLFGKDAGGRRFEVFLLAEREPGSGRWECLVRPGRRVKEPVIVELPGGVTATLTRGPEGFTAAFPLFGAAFFEWLETAGTVPLPPYLKRDATDDDRRTYQTVYARETGSIAAPTAGLHFTDELLAGLPAAGVSVARVTLHVGYGTFAPIQTESLDDHAMHAETYVVPAATMAALEATRTRGGRIIAVGTTSLRAIESIPHTGLAGSTRLFIQPGYRFQWADGLITNFHLPGSTLYVLVAAFLGLGRARASYAEAIRERYRFYSYGDAMLILP